MHVERLFRGRITSEHWWICRHGMSSRLGLALEVETLRKSIERPREGMVVGLNERSTKAIAWCEGIGASPRNCQVANKGFGEGVLDDLLWGAGKQGIVAWHVQRLWGLVGSLRGPECLQDASKAMLLFVVVAA